MGDNILLSRDFDVLFQGSRRQSGNLQTFPLRKQIRKLISLNYVATAPKDMESKSSSDRHSPEITDLGFLRD